MAEMNAAVAEEPWPGDLAADLAMAPWRYAQTVHDAIVSSCHIWASIFLQSDFPPHPHEPEPQLEIPDPLASASEQDLFA